VLVTQSASGFARHLQADAAGRFTLVNLPLDTYLVAIEAPGFEPVAREVPLRSNVPVTETFDLRIASQLTVVTVVAGEGASRVDSRSTGTRTTMDQAVIEGRPLPIGSSRGIEAVLVGVPGVRAERERGHPSAGRAQPDDVRGRRPRRSPTSSPGPSPTRSTSGWCRTAELMTGNIPAEFGGKVSGVADRRHAAAASARARRRRTALAVAGTLGGFGSASRSRPPVAADERGRRRLLRVAPPR
jgi:hypothetical protein